ncbi:uncharacterized protein LOC106174419 isoform X2 [Lingula anatina]|uniref:Uncharacterized protein LOC106174419 isoform X2 n=1 Tax=Lingula anatina TaxID=7574 RepID=A0A1S3JNA2_LINAN|nr:uncharacterized protein LOC106174419 isoform X2 [Lingula anatina]|eukprot:XP_013411429.1 uncharacterized protein LOC106174419 isoform X2 [Lingula anatina]
MDPFPTPIKTYSRRTKVFLKGTTHQIFSPKSCKQFEDSLVSETLGESNRGNCSSVSSKAVLSTSGSGVGVRTVLGSKASDWETCEDLDDSIELPRDATEAIDHHHHRVAFSGEEGEDITLALKQTALKTSKKCSLHRLTRSQFPLATSTRKENVSPEHRNSTLIDTDCAKSICDIPPPECMSTIHEFPGSATEERNTTGLAIFKRDISSSLAGPQKNQLPLVSIPLPNIETCNLLCKQEKKKRRAVRQSFELSNDRGDNVHSENKNGKQLKPGQCFNSTLIGAKATNIKEVKITPDVSSITGFLSNKQSVSKSTKSAEIREKAAFVKGDECMADSTTCLELDCHLGQQKKTEQCFNSTLINNQAINIKEANVMPDLSSIAASSDMFPSAVMKQLISEVTPNKPSVSNVNGCLSPVKGNKPLMRQGRLCPKNSTVLFTSQNLDIAEVIPPDLSRVTAASEMTDICGDEGEDQEEITLEAPECDAPVEEYNESLRCKVPEEENYDQNKTQESLVQKRPGSKSERQRKGKPRTKLNPNSETVNPLEDKVETTRTTFTAPLAKVQRKKSVKNKNNQDKSVEDSNQTLHNEPQRVKELKAKSKNIKSVRDARKQKYKTLTDKMEATEKKGGTSNERDNQVQESEVPLNTLGKTPEDHTQNSQKKAQKRKKSDFKKVRMRKSEANLVCEETVCSIKNKTAPCKKKVRTSKNKNAALEVRLPVVHQRFRLEIKFLFLYKKWDKEVFNTHTHIYILYICFQIPRCFIELMDFPSIPMPMRRSYFKLDKRPDQYEEDGKEKSKMPLPVTHLNCIF